jgi:peroxiredoxin
MAYSVDEPIDVGQTVPNIEVEMITNYASAGAGQVGETKPILSVLGTGTSILLGMPGAYTPTCTDIHLPGFYQAYSDFRRLGVSKIALITTNDRFVNAEWQKSMEQCQGVPEGESPIVMLSDARGDLAEALGLIGYLGRALGVRSKRFALVLQDGVVKYKAVDEGSDKLVGTSAEAVLKFVRSDMDGGFSLDGLVLPAGAAALLFLIISIANLFS